MAVIDRVGDTTPVSPVSGTPSPLRVWSWQARNLAVETAAGGGLPGSLIDQLAPVPAGVLPASYLLAGYITGVNTPGARALRLYMGNQDWHHPGSVIFPLLALALFSSDSAVSAESQPGQTGGTAKPARFEPATGGGSPSTTVRLADVVSNPCSTIGGFANDVLNAIFSALNRAAEATLPSLLATVVSIGLGLAKGFVSGLIGTLLAPIVKAVTAAVSMLTIAFEIVSMLKPWSLAMPSARNSYSGNSGAMTLSVQDDTPFTWPSQLQDCAMAIAGQPLPTLQGLLNAPVDWTVDDRPDKSQQATWVAVQDSSPATIDQTSLDTSLRRDHTASLAYTTGSEPRPCDQARPVTSTYVIQADVTRIDAERLQQIVPSILQSALSGLPAILQGIFAQAASGLVTQITDLLTSLAGHDRILSTLYIDHHDGSSCQHTPPPHPSPPSPSAGPYPDSCQLLTAAAVSSVLGGGPRQNYFPPGPGRDGNACEYSPTSENWTIAWALVGVTVPSRSIDPSLLHPGYAPLQGLGDEAYIQVTNMDGVARVWVRSGSTVLLVVAVMGSHGAQQTVLALARLAVAAI